MNALPTRRGMTLLEVAIATAILSALALMVYGVFVGTQKSTDREMALRDMESRLNRALRRMAADIKDGSAGMARAVPLVDARFAAEAAFDAPEVVSAPHPVALAIPSGRDKAGIFRTDGKGGVVWQSLIVYALHWDAVEEEGELRRYVVHVDDISNPVQQAAFRAFFDPERPRPAVSVTPTQLDLGGVLVPRDSGELVMRKARLLTVLRPEDDGAIPEAPQPWNVHLSAARHPLLERAVSVQSGALRGRN